MKILKNTNSKLVALSRKFEGKAVRFIVSPIIAWAINESGATTPVLPDSGQCQSRLFVFDEITSCWRSGALSGTGFAALVKLPKQDWE